MSTLEEAEAASRRGFTLLTLAMPSMSAICGDWPGWIEADGRRATAVLHRDTVADLLAGVRRSAVHGGHDLRWVAETFHDLLYDLVARYTEGDA